MKTFRFSLAPLLMGLTAVGCGGVLGAAPSSFEPLRATSDVVPLDGPVKGPRLVPESVALEKTFGVEPGGGVRGIAAGVRVVSFASGAVLTAPDRLSQLPTAIVVLPDRFGSGVLFAIGDTLWRAERWLARAEPIFRAPVAIRGVWVGLDRVYLKLPSGAVIAVHPSSGAMLDLGALPASPSITAFAALDGFRAVALADMRGVVATIDAGATWRSLSLPIEPRTLVLENEMVTVGGGREIYEVRPEGDFGRVDSRARAAADAQARIVGEGAKGRAADGFDKTFGARPLATAVTDGVPLADGTVLVARDGALAKVRLADGAIVDVARDAFPLRPSRCRAIALGHREGKAGGGAGFVCGEPQGRTHVYGYNPARRGLDLAMAFDSPRVVLPGGTGAVAIRGRCADDAESAAPVPGSPATEITYCVRDAAGAEREQVLTAYVESARVVALRDGTLAVIAPPRGDLASGHVTLATKSGAKTVRISFDESDAKSAPRESDAARRVITQGMWLDGFEEREPGVLAGWVEHAGTLLGVEVRIDGRARHGAFVRDAGTAVVAGRYGLGWTSASRGYETVDGGMNWRTVDLPEPTREVAPGKGSASVRTHPARGCSAAGCVLEGWIRVGYGDTAPPGANPTHSMAVPRAPTMPVLEMTCDVVARGRTFSGAPRTASGSARVGSLASPHLRSAGEFTPFYSMPPPEIHTEEVGTSFEVQELVDHARPGLVARAYVWGAKGIEWDNTAKWTVRWTSPFASSSEIFSSAASKPPRAIMEAARFAAAAGSMRALSGLTFATSDDARHALLVVARSTTPHGLESYAIVLDEGRAPVEVRREGGEPFGRIEGALRHEGRWFLLTEPDAGEPAAAVLWEVEAGVGREIVRVPRVVEGTARSNPVRIAKRDGEALLGLVVDGQHQVDRASATRWVIGIDVANARVSELELLGTADFGGKGLVPCGGDDGGWAVDVPLTGQPIRAMVAGKPASLKAGYGRVRLSRGKACVDRLTAVYDGSADDLKGTGRPGAGRTVELGLLTGLARQELRCGK